MAKPRSRLSELIQGIFKILLSAPEGGFSLGREIIPRLKDEVPPRPDEQENYPSGNNVYYVKAIHSSLTATKVGWLAKDGGRWSLTDEGKEVYDRFTAKSEDLYRKSKEEYRRQKGDKSSEEIDPDESSEQDDMETSSVTLEIAEESAWSEVEGRLSGIPPYDFQKIVAGLLEGMGHHIEWEAPPGPDSGVDIHAAAGGVAGRRIKVQVKRRQDVISVDEIRSFRDTLKAGDTGLFVSIGGFTKEAIKTARVGEEHLILINGKRFFDLWVSHYEKIPEEHRQLLPIKRVAFLNLQ